MMKHSYSPGPDQSLMKLSPESDINPSRPYCRQVYIPEIKEVSNGTDNTVKKFDFKIGLSASE